MDLSAADVQTRLILAQANDATLDVLAQLASDEHAEVRQAVALNPNASEDILRQLGAEFPEEVVQNPIFDILILENPNSSFVYLSKARSAATSSEALAIFGKSTEEEILIAVGSNPSTPAHVLEDIVKSPPVLNDYEYAESDDYHRIFSAIAQNPNTSVATIRRLHEEWRVVDYAIAQNPITPPDILGKLSNRQNSEMQLALLKNPALPINLVERLAIESNEQVQLAVQCHPNKPKNIKELTEFAQKSSKVSSRLLLRLASDKRAYIRLSVAEHPNTPASAIEKLMKDEDQKIAYAAVHNPNANEVVLEKYVAYLVRNCDMGSQSDKLGIYRTADQLLEHPELTSKVISALLVGMPHIEYQLATMETVPATTLIEIANRPRDIDVCCNLARNPAMSAEGLGLLFIFLTKSYPEHSVKHCIANIAKHPNLSELLFYRLIKMPKAASALAFNPSLTDRMGEKLIATRDTRTLCNLARNAHTPPNVLLHLMREETNVRGALAKNESLPLALVETLAADLEPHIRATIAQRPSLPVAILQTLSQDEVPYVCACVAVHPKTPMETLEQLIQHPDEIVRGAVGRNIKATPLMLLALASEDSVEIRADLALRSDLNEAIIEILFRKTAIDLPNDCKERIRRGKSHEEAVMARIAAHPNVSQRLRSRILSDYGIW